MNFNGFEFDEPTKRLLTEMDGGGRLPHALIIESEQEDKAAQLALFLSMAAVCGNAERPCGVCKNCLNAQKKNHPDVQYLQLEPKKKQYTVDQMRALIADAYIIVQKRPPAFDDHPVALYGHPAKGQRVL